jgi:hypothetical protein
VDVGHRIRARYWVVNALGYDVVESGPTGTVLVALVPPPPIQRPPHPAPQPPQPRVDPLKLTIAPFVVARRPPFAVRNGKRIVDTGRRMSCPGAAGGLPCNLRIVARPSGASADWHGSPTVAAESTVPVAAGTGAKVSFRLGSRAYRLLRAHHRLGLVIAATITRRHSAPVRSTFTITVKAPARRKR